MKGFRGDSALSDIELEELLAQKALDRGITHRLLPLVRPVRRLIAGVIAIEIVQVLAIFARPLLIGLVIDKGCAMRAAAGGSCHCGLGLRRAGRDMDGAFCAGRPVPVCGGHSCDPRAQRSAHQCFCPCAEPERELFRQDQGGAHHVARIAMWIFWSHC
jgi:hypothetical protein